MANKITRTITTSTIYCARVFMREGNVELETLEPIVISDVKVDVASADKYVRKMYGKKDNYIVTSIDYANTTYSMPLDTFLSMATLSVTEEADA